MTPLFKKLNFKDQKSIVVINAPESLHSGLDEMSVNVPVRSTAETNGEIDFALVFVTSQPEIDNILPLLLPKLNGDVVLWFCYPKGTSKKYKSTINRDKGWDILGRNGFEPVRQVAIDEDWSALRFRKATHIKTMKRGFAMSEEGKKKVSSKQ